jgi:hypothetical protein
VYANGAISIEITISNCSFSECSTGANGGAIYFGIGSSFVLENSNFSYCSAVGYGGAIALNNDNKAARKFNSCSFDNGTALNAVDIYDERSGNEGLNTESNVINCSSTSDRVSNTKHWFIAYGNSVLDCLFVNGGSCIPEIIHVSTTGFTINCGTEESPCTTVEIGLELIEKNTSTQRLILINKTTIAPEDGGYYNVCNIQIGTRNIKIAKYGNDKPVLIYGVGGGGERYVFGLGPSSVLEVVDIIFDFTPLTTSIPPTIGQDLQAFFITRYPSSLLRITNCEFYSDIPITKPFVLLYKGKVYIKDCKIVDVSVGNTQVFHYDDATLNTTVFEVTGITWENVIADTNSVENDYGIYFGAFHMCDSPLLCSEDEESVYGAMNITIEGWSVIFDSNIYPGNSSLIYVKSINESSIVNIHNVVVNFNENTGGSYIANGGTLHFVGNALLINISSSSFNNSYSNNAGGTFYFEVENVEEAYISNCNFSNGRSIYGGAIYTNFVFYLSDSQFVNNVIGENGKGIDIFYNNTNNINNFTKLHVIDSCSYSSGTSANHPFEVAEVLDASGDNIYDTYLVDDCFNKEYYITRNGANSNCGVNQTTPCKFISAIFGMMDNNAENTAIINIVSTPYNVSSVEVENRRVLLQNTTQNTRLTVDSGGNTFVFSVKNGSLRFRYLTIEYIKPSLNKVLVNLTNSGDFRLLNCIITQYATWEASLPLVVVNNNDGENGRVVIQNTRIENLSLRNVSLIDITQGADVEVIGSRIEGIVVSLTQYPLFIKSLEGYKVKITIKNTVFQNIEITEGYGNVYGGIVGVNGDSSNNSSVEIDSVTVSNVNTSYTRGGFFYGDKLYRFSIVGTLSKTEFSEVKGADSGGALYLQGVNSASITNAIFIDVQSNFNGGAVYFGTTTGFYLADVKFTLCGCNNLGGAILTTSARESAARNLVRVVFERNYAGMGLDICDQYLYAEDVYSTTNVYECTSSSVAASSSQISKFYLSQPQFFFDCLLPSEVGAECGYGDILVHSISGKNHRFCGSAVQACQNLSFAIGVAVSGSFVELSETNVDYPLGKTEVLNKKFTIRHSKMAPTAQPSIVIYSLLDTVGNALFEIKNSSVSIVKLIILYNKPVYGVYRRPLFVTADENAELVLRGCKITSNFEQSPSTFVLDQILIQNNAGHVEVDGLDLKSINKVDSYSLFTYNLSSTPSSFTIRNTTVSSLSINRPLLSVTNLTSVSAADINNGNIYLQYNVFESITIFVDSSLGDGINGSVISIDLATPGYLESIYIADNVFDNLTDPNDLLRNGGFISIYIDQMDDSYSYLLYNNTFVEGRAVKGGAIYIEQTHVWFVLNSFHRCVATDTGSGRAIHINSTQNYSNNLDFVDNCRNPEDQYAIDIYIPPNSNPQSYYFTAKCVGLEAADLILLDAVQLACSSVLGSTRCRDLTGASQILGGRQVRLTQNIDTDQSVSLGDKTTLIIGEYGLSSGKVYLSSISTTEFIQISNGRITIQNLILLHKNFTYFIINETLGSLRIVDCDVKHENEFGVIKSFISSTDTANNARVYITGTTFESLSYARAVISLSGASALLLKNVNILSFKSIISSSNSVAEASFIEVNTTVPDPESSVALENVEVIGADLRLMVPSSKGLISLSANGGLTTVSVFNSTFKNIRVSSNTPKGGVFYVEGCQRVIFEETTLNTIEGSEEGGAIYLKGCITSSFKNTYFNNTYAIGANSKGGAVYAQLYQYESDKSTSVFFDGGYINGSRASQGKGGAVYLYFSLDVACSVSDVYVDNRSNSFYFNSIAFTNNSALSGTNVYIEARNLTLLITEDKFIDVNVTVNEEGLLGYNGYDICEDKEVNLIDQLYGQDDDFNLLIYVGSSELDCSSLSGSVLNTCVALRDALITPGNSQSLKIEVINTADLNDVVAIYGNKVLIAPPAYSSYVVLVIGPYGTIYVEAGELNLEFESETTTLTRRSNELQAGNLTLSRMEIRLAYKAGGTPNPFIVVLDGIVTFDACSIRSGSENDQYPNHVTKYIADVINNGLLEFNGCSITNIYVEDSPLIQTFDFGQMIVKVI